MKDLTNFKKLKKDAQKEIMLASGFYEWECEFCGWRGFEDDLIDTKLSLQCPACYAKGEGECSELRQR